MSRSLSLSWFPENRRSDILVALFIALAGIVFCVYAFKKPAGDFANYFYSAHALRSGDSWNEIYDIFWFNLQHVGKADFANHMPVPPQSLFFYQPFRYCHDLPTAKLIYNLLGVSVFSFAFYRLLRSGILKAKTAVYLLALPALVPLYYNVLFGQAYTYLAAALIGVLLLYHKGHIWLPALLLSAVVALKITPVILLFFFIVRRDWRFTGAFLLFSLVFLFLGTLAAGYGTVMKYYVHVLPRLLDGYVSDPYSTSFHGFIVILRRLFSPDALLNPDAPFRLDGPWISLVNGIFVLALLWFVLREIVRRNFSLTDSFYLLLLFLFLTSGYTSTYSFLLLLPFFPQLPPRRAIAVLGLVALVMVLPPRMLDGWPALPAHFKFLLLLPALFLCGENKKMPLPVVARMLLGGMVLLAAIRFFSPSDIPSIRYFAPGQIKDHFVFRFGADSSGISYASYKQSGITLSQKAAMSLPPLKQLRLLDSLNRCGEVFLPGHWQARSFYCLGDTVVFLSDYKRGPGLFNIYGMPEAEFEKLIKH